MILRKTVQARSGRVRKSTIRICGFPNPGGLILRAQLAILKASKKVSMVDEKWVALYELSQELILLRDAHRIAEMVLDIAARLLDCQDSNFWLVDEACQELYVAAARGFLQGSDIRQPLSSQRGIVVAAARTRRPVRVPDVSQDPRYIQWTFQAASELAVPVLIENRVLGVLNVESIHPNAFTETDQELLSILASQAALALENARLYADEQRRAQEMATLNVISQRICQSLDLQSTLQAIVDSAAGSIPCALAEVSLWNEQTGMLTLHAIHCEPDRSYPVGESFPPGEGFTGWVVRNRRSLLVPDVDACQGIRPDLLPGELPFRAYAGVPMLAGETLVGTLVLVADQKGAFHAGHLNLLEALSHQAVIAIRNAQLFEETKRQAHKLAVVNAIASAINRPLPLQDMLDLAVQQVLEVMGTDFVALRLVDRRAKTLTLASSSRKNPEETPMEDPIQIPPDFQDRLDTFWEPLVFQNPAGDPRLAYLGNAMASIQTLAIVPLKIKEKTVGFLGIGTHELRQYSVGDLDLLAAIGHQVSVAMENASLVADLSHRARELEVVHSVAEVVNRPGDLDKILAEGLRQILAVTGLEMGAIGLIDPKDRTLTLRSHQGMSPGFAAWLEGRLRAKLISAEIWPSDLAIYIEDLSQIHPALPEQVLEEDLRLYAEIPLFAESALVGVLIVATHGTHVFSTAEKHLLQAVGHQLGMAMTNARLRQESLAAERLAAVGRVAASVAHDLRSPLGGLLRSAEFLGRPELSPATRQKVSQASVSLARRLINNSQQILDFIQQERLPLNCASCQLSEFLDSVLAVLEVDFSDRGIEVEKRAGYLGEVCMDGDRMAQVVYNIAANARDAMPHGGKFMVSTRKAGDFVEIRLADNGPGVPREIGERIFEPFFSYGKRQGAGLGLAIARRIVEEHGGKLLLESQEGQGACFIIRLPG